MMLIVAYLASFAAGPATFWILARRRAEAAGFALLGVMALMLLMLVYILPRHAGTAWRDWAYFEVLLLALLWLAWTVVLAFCVQCARHRMTDGPGDRWAFSIGAMATTLPWFGLLIAQGVNG